MQLGFTAFAAKCPLQAIDDMIVRMMFIIKKDTVVAVYFLSTGKKKTTDHHANKNKIVNSVLSNTSNSSLDSLREMSHTKKWKKTKCIFHVKGTPPHHLCQKKTQKPCIKYKRFYSVSFGRESPITHLFFLVEVVMILGAGLSDFGNTSGIDGLSSTSLTVLPHPEVLL